MSSTAHLRSQIGAIFEMGVGPPPPAPDIEKWGLHNVWEYET